MSAASIPRAPRHIPEHCPSCGHGHIDWGQWSKSLRKSGLKIRIKHVETGKTYVYKTQQARAFLAIHGAGKAGVSKAQLAGFHLGHYAQMMREDGLPCTTEMQAVKFPWPSRYGLYKLTGTYEIEDVTGRDDLPAITKATREQNGSFE